MSHLSTSRKSRHFGVAALALTASVLLAAGGSGASASNLPAYQVNGFVVSLHQHTLLMPANAQERLPETPFVYGSPHQIAVLTPRRRPTI